MGLNTIIFITTSSTIFVSVTIQKKKKLFNYLMIMLHCLKLNTEQWQKKESKQNLKLEKWREEELEYCLQRLQILFAQVKAGSASENLINEI